MKIEEILGSDALTERERITALMQKTVIVPPWVGPEGLEREYDPRQHPVTDRGKYRDQVTAEGVTRVTRITLDLQRLAARRMSELVTGIPVRRVYHPENERQQEVAAFLERIFTRTRIDSVNPERCVRLFAGCEVFTLWYAVEESNTAYGVRSPLKLRCRTFSPMLGDELYPFFDEYGDMTAMSIGYVRRVGERDVKYFDTYTATHHVKWSDESGDWEVVEAEETTLGKIPGVYAWRPTPVWEDTSSIVYEMEWALSRNGNYLRENSKPRFIVYADDIISYGDEKGPDDEFRSVMQYPQGARAEYVTWPQATESLKYFIDQLRSLFFTQLQLPDWSYEKMSQQALSGESRKQMFIDAELKVGDESGRLLEFFDREVNVVKAFAKLMLGKGWEDDIDSLEVENVITPYRISDEKEQVEILLSANGQKPLMSQRESIEAYGKSGDVEATLREIRAEESLDALEMSE